MSSGRFDIGVDEIANTSERRKAVQFVNYFRSGMGLLARRGATLDINNLCGHTLALTQGSSQVAVAERLSKNCVAGGKAEIKFLFYPNSADTYLAVANGRGDGFLTERAVGFYVAKQNDKLEMMPGMLNGETTISAIVIGKDNNQLAQAIALALKGMIADGSYKSLLDEFGVPESALAPADVTMTPDS